MKMIPNINITLEDYQNLQKNFCQRGGEGIICHRDGDTLYKLVLDQDCDSSPMPENKLIKLLSLY